MDKIRTLEELKVEISEWRREGKNLVFTNGCFDILHPGHIYFLERASQLGNVLIVGINSDYSVANIKGQQRPVFPLKDRMTMLSAVQFVDAIISFDESTPEILIGEIMPDVLVKGNDYEISNIVGRELVIQNGGTVQTIELLKGYSTTEILNRIKKD